MVLAIRVSAAVAVGLACFVLQAEGSCKSLQCPSANGYFSHPQSCVRYVKCIDNVAHVEACPANLHYNARTGMCDKSKSAMCDEAMKKRSKSCLLEAAPKLRSSPVPGVACDCGKCCRKPDPSDCSSFFECDESGNAYKKTCSEGLVYNPLVEDCDLSVNYECPNLPTCSCKCRYPVTDECDAFYMCKEVGSVVQKLYCSEGLLFNSETEMCDLPDNVECPATVQPTSAPETCRDLKNDCRFWAANGDCECQRHRHGGCAWPRYVRRNCPASCSRCGGSGGGHGGGGSGSGEHGGGSGSGEHGGGSGSGEHGGGHGGGSGSGEHGGHSGEHGGGSGEHGGGSWEHGGGSESGEHGGGSGSGEHGGGSGSGEHGGGSGEHGGGSGENGGSGSGNGGSGGGSGGSGSGNGGSGGGSGGSGSGNGGSGGGSGGSGSGNGGSGGGSGGSGSGNGGSGGGSGGSGAGNGGSGGGSGGASGGGSGIIDGCVINCELGQFYPHPSDCTKYIQCTPYGPQEMPCPLDTRWDQSILTCNYESATDCVTGSYVDENGKTCGGSSGGSGGSGVIDGCVVNCELGQYYPHPTDCTKFIQCTPYGPQEMPCGAGTRWDQSILTCNHESVTQCVTGSYLDENGKECGGSGGNGSGGGGSGGIVDGCVINCEVGQYYPHPTDCTKFIQCAPYGPQEMPCGAGTRWDQSILTCNHESVTPCVTGSYLDENGKECGGSGGNGSGGGGSGGIVDGCVINCEVGQYYPHPTDCTKFIQCAPYGPQEMPCGAGTRWNQSILTCNHESVTECVTGSYVDGNGNTCGGSSGGSGGSGVIDGCVVNCQLGQYYPHPTDCTKFIQCAPYGPQEMPCGAGTRWDQSILTCNHESVTPCVTGSYLDENGKECGGSGGNGGGGGGSGGIVDGCVINCEVGQYYPHPTDCTKFIQCAPYGPQEMPCAPGTRWDQELLTCHHEGSTKCFTGTYVDANGEPCGGSSGGGGTGGGECDIRCPESNGLFAHPADCRKWVHCSNDIPHVKDCPAKLHFDPVLRVCNWPKNAACIAGEALDCQIPVVPKPPTEAPVTPPEVCDCECCLRPHPEDCQSYYYCDGGNTEFHTCSEGLVFHPENETCVFAADYPECEIILPPECKCECLYPSPICSEYFKCVNSKPQRLECPNGLYFNNKIHACDLPANVDCQSPGQYARYAGRHAPAISANDCNRLDDGQYAAKTGTKEFYICRKGVGFLLKCQEPTSFDPRLRRCVHH
ncbi:hornerin isoform X2 [Hyalella azteca]|uniref:Hornerin isoform X2 n=1 Tax=Hyalella azteca TaxID=294128 RepID=A0A8B7PJ54_HYAAZ|nr:hornerin isoform X2 [Hyalella azteca]